MPLRRIFVQISVILCTMTGVAHSDNSLKDIRPKDIKNDFHQELLPVAVPRPLQHVRNGKAGDLEGEDYQLESTERKLKSQRPSLLDVALTASVKEGLKAMRQVYGVIEPDMLRNGHILHDDHPAALLSKFSAPTTENNKWEMAAFATLTATKAFRKSYDLNNDLARQAHNQRVSLRRTALESLCPPRDPPVCMPASERYRTHDGTCNNKRRLRWGSAQMPFNRFLPPEYGDGVDSVRQSALGGPLSSSRFVSLLVHGARDGEASITLMLAQWGQLLDHDLTSTAQPRSINGSVPSCCGNTDFHPSCLPIKVPLDDPWLSPLKVRCLEFLRSAAAQRRDCVLSWREQTNQATSFIDASPIYSNSVKSSDNARVFRKGLLIFGRGDPNADTCQKGAIATRCIRSGDGRSSEQPGLLALHHVWVGEHNLIAMRLSKMNSHWSDEKIYQETRKIIGAMFQHITYREFLPIVLGREVVKLFDLELLNSGYYEGYDPKTNPAVANAFAAAAFRFGHSLIQNSYTRCDRFHNVLPNNVSLHEEFQRGDIGSAGSLHRLIRGMANQKALKRDEFITPELTNHLFQTPGFPFGLDLAAINIQRGRDHGIPPYTNWRIPCGLSPINTWEEFANVVGPESARRISHAYHNVHDIDLFVGGIAERPVAGGIVGPTFACIIAQQFSNSRKGDRFWYENGGMENSFTPAQLHSLRRITFASVLCRSVGGGTFQPHIFLPPDVPKNERLPCGVGPLANIDLNPWMEQDIFATSEPLPPQLITHPTVQSPSLGRPEHMLQPQNFEPPLLDRIFEIVQEEIETKSPILLQPHKAQSEDPQKQEDVISHLSLGFHGTKNVTKINDKLDFKRKASAGHTTKQKPLPGVSNKLDKHSRRGVNRQGIVHTTTRKTVIVNNIPIELRNVDQVIATSSTAAQRTGDVESRTESTKTNHSAFSDALMRAKIADKSGLTNSPQLELSSVNMSHNHIELTKSVLKNTNEANITLFSNTKNEGHENKLLNRDIGLYKSRKPNEWNALATNHTNKSLQLDIERGATSPIRPTMKRQDVEPHGNLLRNQESNLDPVNNSQTSEHVRSQRNLITQLPGEFVADKSNCPKQKALLKTNTGIEKQNRSLSTIAPNKRKDIAPHNSELRQNQQRPAFTISPNVVVDAGNGNSQYQIEINIRQSNKGPTPHLGTTYKDFANYYPADFHDQYTANYVNFKTTTPIHAPFQHSPTVAYQTLGHSKITKPPTIIFLSEQGEQTSTTRQPGHLHSIVGWSSGSRRPFPLEERPSALSGTHQKPAFDGTSSFSQAQLSGGVVHATSQSVSNGHFGTISGFTSANGADSTFSFNIRPHPDQTLNNRPEFIYNNGFTYTTSKSRLTPKPQYGTNITPYDKLYEEVAHSPFSSGNSQTYYIRKKTRPQVKEEFVVYREPAAIDYEDLNNPRNSLRNISTSDYKDVTDVDYDDDYGNSPYLRKFKKDGYLRPEPILKIKDKGSTTNNDVSSNRSQTLDDNYVLPAMKSVNVIPTDPSKSILSNQSSISMDSQSKHLNVSIFAEEQNTQTTTDEHLVESNKLKLDRKGTSFIQPTQKNVAFAPIKVLTKPERPDNWVIYESVNEEPALPQIPDVKMDLAASSEIPKPFKENFWTNFRLALQYFQSNATDSPNTWHSTNDTYVTPLGSVASKNPADSIAKSTTEKTTTNTVQSSALDGDIFSRTTSLARPTTDLPHRTDSIND